MTTELEQEFFRVFGIEPKTYCCKPDIKRVNPTFCEHYIECKNCDYLENKYPQITSDILLKLICILNDFEGIDVKATTIEELKEELLIQCIEYFKYPIAFEENADLCNLHNKIQQLFEEEE